MKIYEKNDKKSKIYYQKTVWKPVFEKFSTAKPGCKVGCKICPSALRNGRENPLHRTPTHRPARCQLSQQSAYCVYAQDTTRRDAQHTDGRGACEELKWKWKCLPPRCKTTNTATGETLWDTPLAGKSIRRGSPMCKMWRKSQVVIARSHWCIMIRSGPPMLEMRQRARNDPVGWHLSLMIKSGSPMCKIWRKVQDAMVGSTRSNQARCATHRQARSCRRSQQRTMCMWCLRESRMKWYTSCKSKRKNMARENYCTGTFSLCHGWHSLDNAYDNTSDNAK